MQISSSEFQKQIGFYQDKAQAEPVFVSRNGRNKTVLLSVDAYEKLQKLARRSLSVAELSDAELATLETTEMPSTFDHLNTELN